jgi:hypothetical protein
LEELKRQVYEVQLIDQEDVVRWTIGSSGCFKLKDVYLQLRSTRIYPHKFIWKIKMTLKVKNFIWLVAKNYILLKTTF